MPISCVYVTYEPDVELLTRSISSIKDQVDVVFIVDNSSSDWCSQAIEDQAAVELIRLGENKGIAFAQNVGLEKAKTLGCDYIMLSDQDTLYPSDYIVKMLPCFEGKDKIAAIAPRFIDNNKSYSDGFISIESIFFSQFHPKSGYHEIHQCIASGKIISVEALESIGLMLESLFIDWVDIEWCWRARAQGYSILGNADVEISHQLGDESVSVGFREVNLRSPMRHYYITRNAFYLAVHKDHLPLNKRIVLFLRSFRYVVSFPLLAKPRCANFKAVILGFFHGIIGKLGYFKL